MSFLNLWENLHMQHSRDTTFHIYKKFTNLRPLIFQQKKNFRKTLCNPQKCSQNPKNSINAKKIKNMGGTAQLHPTFPYVCRCTLVNPGGRSDSLHV